MTRRYVIYSILFVICLIPFRVKADCSNDEWKSLKDTAKSVEITYDYDNSGIPFDSELYTAYSVDDDGMAIPYGDIKITISGVSEQVYIKDVTYKRTFYSSAFKEGVLELHYEKNGSRKFEVYSDKCSKSLRTIHVKIPKYNAFSEDPYCYGIEDGDLSVCKKWYDGELDFETFEKKVLEYKDKLKEKEAEMRWKNSIVYKTIDFVVNNYESIFIFIVAVLVILGLVFVIRKRSELK